MTDGHKEARGSNHMLFTGQVVFDLHTVHGLFTEHFHRFRVVEDFDVFEAVDAVLHGFRRTHHITTNEHGHLGAQFGEVARFFTRAVSRTDNHHLLVAIEKPVAHGACTDAATEVTQTEFAFEA